MHHSPLPRKTFGVWRTLTPSLVGQGGSWRERKATAWGIKPETMFSVFYRWCQHGLCAQSCFRRHSWSPSGWRYEATPKLHRPLQGNCVGLLTWETEEANKCESLKCLYLEHKDPTHSAPSHSTSSLLRIYIYIYMCSSKNNVYKIRAGAEKVQLEKNVYLKLGNLSILLFVISHRTCVWKSGIEDHPSEAWQLKKY